MATLYATAGPKHEQRWGNEPRHPDLSLGRFYTFPVGHTIKMVSGVASVVQSMTVEQQAACDTLDAGGTSSVPGQAIWSFGRGSFTISAAEATAIQALDDEDGWVT